MPIDLGNGLSLEPIPEHGHNASDAHISLCQQLAESDPWHRLGISSSTLQTSLAERATDVHIFTVLTDGNTAGVLKLRHRWLFGVYVELIGLLPTHRGSGTGQRLIQHVETRAHDMKLKNVWICVSEFNSRARDFYARVGYVETANLGGLVVPHENEILLRKRL